MEFPARIQVAAVGLYYDNSCQLAVRTCITVTLRQIKVTFLHVVVVRLKCCQKPGVSSSDQMFCLAVVPEHVLPVIVHSVAGLAPGAIVSRKSLTRLCTFVVFCALQSVQAIEVYVGQNLGDRLCISNRCVRTWICTRNV